VFYNVLCDYKYLKQENQRTYLDGVVHRHRKIGKVYVCTTDDMAYIDTVFKFLPYNIQVLTMIRAVKNIDAPMLMYVWKEHGYRIDVCRVTRGAHIEYLKLSKISFSVFLWL
jgi:hypothetical protein